MGIEYSPSGTAATVGRFNFSGYTYEDPGSQEYATQNPDRIDAKYFLDPTQSNILGLWQAGGGLAGYQYSNKTWVCPSGVTVGDPVYISADLTVALALATTVAASKVFGFVAEKPTSTSCLISHFVKKTGLAALTAGSTVYLTNAGGYSLTPGTVPKIVGRAENETTAWLSALSSDGVSGYSGYSGAVGTSGYSGVGTSGYSGTSGIGTSGLSGVSGATGASGYSGATLDSGYSGVSGATGASGYSGATLDSGYSGVSGATGASGMSGISGTNGASGYSGKSGVFGTNGASGYSGYTGPAGVQGDSGYSGIEGTSGISGVEGSSGYSGVSGASTSGYSGISGAVGTSGVSGTEGTSGISGTSGIGTSGYSGSVGESGSSGISGQNGTSGYSGKSGVSGISGLGLSGYSGASGLAGASGTSGIPGSSGYSGISGSTGATGTSGYSGLTLLSGYSGEAGPTGSSGLSGAAGVWQGTDTITYVLDGGNYSISNGIKGSLIFDYPFTLEDWVLIADQEGDLEVDVWRTNYAGHPANSTNSICSTNTPVISNALKGRALNMSGWTTSIAAGSVLTFYVVSCSAITRATLALKITRT